MIAGSILFTIKWILAIVWTIGIPGIWTPSPTRLDRILARSKEMVAQSEKMVTELRAEKVERGLEVPVSPDCYCDPELVHGYEHLRRQLHREQAA